MAKILYTQSYIKRAKKIFNRHPDLIPQYSKTLKLLEANPFHTSLRLHRLHGNLSELYSVSINISYRISVYFIIENDTIVPVDIGSHDEVY
jgi:proteic killer suppression protein